MDQRSEEKPLADIGATDNPDPIASVALKLPRWLNENLVLAAIPIVAYFIAFAFQQSYCDAFGIPLFLADVSATTIFTYASIIVVLWWLIIYAAEGLSVALDERQHKGQSSYFLYFCFAVIVYILEGCEWNSRVKVVFLMFAITFILDCLVSWFLVLGEDKKLPTIERLMGFHRMLPSSRNYQLLNHPTGKRVVLFCYSAFAIYFLSLCLGDYAAHSKTKYLVSKADPSLILVTLKGETAICSRYDPKTKKVLREVELKPISELHAFVEKDVGTLDFGR